MQRILPDALQILNRARNVKTVVEISILPTTPAVSTTQKEAVL